MIHIYQPPDFPKWCRLDGRGFHTQFKKFKVCSSEQGKDWDVQQTLNLFLSLFWNRQMQCMSCFGGRGQKYRICKCSRRVRGTNMPTYGVALLEYSSEWQQLISSESLNKIHIRWNSSLWEKEQSLLVKTWHGKLKNMSKTVKLDRWFCFRKSAHTVQESASRPRKLNLITKLWIVHQESSSWPRSHRTRRCKIPVRERLWVFGRSNLDGTLHHHCKSIANPNSHETLGFSDLANLEQK